MRACIQDKRCFEVAPKEAQGEVFRDDDMPGQGLDGIALDVIDAYQPAGLAPLEDVGSEARPIEAPVVAHMLAESGHPLANVVGAQVEGSRTCWLVLELARERRVHGGFRHRAEDLVQRLAVCAIHRVQEALRQLVVRAAQQPLRHPLRRESRNARHLAGEPDLRVGGGVGRQLGEFALNGAPHMRGEVALRLEAIDHLHQCVSFRDTLPVDAQVGTKLDAPDSAAERCAALDNYNYTTSTILPILNWRGASQGDRAVARNMLGNTQA